jgi:cell division protein FtsB
MRPLEVSARAPSTGRSRPAQSRAGAARGARSQALPILVAERVRWDRVGRVALLFVLVALLYLYLSAGIRILSTYRQERADHAAVSALAREYAVLEQRHRALSEQSTVEAEARRLGMARKGEQQYVVGGLPSN